MTYHLMYMIHYGKGNLHIGYVPARGDENRFKIIIINMRDEKQKTGRGEE